MFRSLLIIALIFCSSTLFAQQTNNILAPGAPGSDAHWPSAAKNGVGTSISLESKVWFTLHGGVLTEVYYPTLDVPNTQMLQFVVYTGGKVETEAEDTTHRLSVTDPRSLSFQQINSAKDGAFTITKNYTTDPQRNTLLIDVQFRTRNNYPFTLFVYYDPSLGNSGRHDTAWTEGDALLASDKDKASALVSSTGFEEMTNGYLGTSDGLKMLREIEVRTIARGDQTLMSANPVGRIRKPYARAQDGNVVQFAKIKSPNRFTLALSFGKNSDEALRNARASLLKGFARTRSEYETGWHRYLSSLRRVETKYQKQFEMCAMVLKAHEDKTYRGATVASLSIPWGGGPSANEPTVSGYHGVWSRDLYEVATALEAMGDRAAALRALRHLFDVQQKRDGSFPQNARVDGRPLGGALQMDEVAFPIVLAHQLGVTDRSAWRRHIKPAADFLISHGPSTEQERWEEKPGYSPSTLAAEIAGLVCAADIARRNGDESSAKNYLTRADNWANDIERWTATTTGKHSNGPYYIRITGNDNPNDGESEEINSGGGTYDEREIVDAGFLELVRLGIKRADDPLILKSLEIVDRLIKVETPNGAAWYRYNHDAYGERNDGGDYDGRTGTGRLWTLLAGERGEFEIARGEIGNARARLDALMRFANDGGMIAEQIWDRKESPDARFRFGEGTGSATPLAWSMAQFIRLAVNIKEGRNTETPAVVASRYLKDRAQGR
ncbi:MAG: glycoside hydrolase family 15 protein [Pyrinomonadaceae bacterium]